MKLSPDVAGITLLALGNGAPDVFTAFAAVNTASDFQLTLGGLLGASVCISSFVLASVLLASKARVEVDKEAFLRDVIVCEWTIRRTHASPHSTARLPALRASPLSTFLTRRSLARVAFNVVSSTQT